MTILKNRYSAYIILMEFAKQRLKRDRAIIKIISRMIKEKKLSKSNELKLNSLLKDN